MVLYSDPAAAPDRVGLEQRAYHLLVVDVAADEGMPIKRYQGVFIDGVIGTAMALYATFVTDFLTALTEFLQIAVIWYATYLAIFVTDQWLRKNRYDGIELHRGAGGRYWYRNGIHWPGIAALAAGIITGLLFASTTRFAGPLSTALSGIDLSYLVSFAVGGAVYWTLSRRTIAAGAEEPARPRAVPELQK
jgi:purine-cytosine permease-like protein